MTALRPSSARALISAPGGEEEVEEVAAAEEGALLERREAEGLADQWIGAALEEELRGRELTGEQRGLERRVLELAAGARVDVGAAIEEELHGGGRAGERGEVEPAPAEVGPCGRELGIALELAGDLAGVADAAPA